MDEGNPQDVSAVLDELRAVQSTVADLARAINAMADAIESLADSGGGVNMEVHLTSARQAAGNALGGG